MRTSFAVVTVESNRALAAIERLYHEQPHAMEAFFEWIEDPSHTQTVTLRFREKRLQTCELERVAR